MVATGTDGAATVGAFKHPLADMYLRRTLDAIVDVAQVVAHDFTDRPAHYGGIPVAVGDTLMQLRTASGSHPEWPTATQRASISDQIAGSQLCRSLAPLRRSAIAIAQQGGDRAAPPLRNDLLDSARAARSSCCAIDEELIIAASRRTGPIFEAATRVLCTPELAQALGQAPVPEGGWPDGGIYAQQMAHICEAISTRIERPHPPGTMTWTKFTILQRVGFWGGTTISALLDDSLTTDGSAAGDESGDRIIEAAYSWALALNDLLAGADVPRAWTDPSYRRKLEVAERDILPVHPAGDIELTGTPFDRGRMALQRLIGRGPGVGGQDAGIRLDTVTVHGELCCVTADVCTSTESTNYCGVTDTGFTCRTSSVCLCLR
jgi:mersacidin/lichenicidin family type 2 lantibiotic